MSVETPAEMEGGAYLTDGKRLAEVVGVDDDGYLHLEDCAASIGGESATIRLTHDELVRDWEAVRRA